MSRLLPLSAFLLLASTAVPAIAAGDGPAFDCAKASHEIETLICGDADLSASDRTLSDVYGQALLAAEGLDTGAAEAVRELKATQRGWIGGRNDCWKAQDKRQCAADEYDRRIAWLQARWMLVKGSDPVFYACDDNAEVVVTFMPSDTPSVRMELGDSTEIGVLTPTGSGARYEADFGVYIWIQGDEAEVAWPQDKVFRCTVRK